MTNGITNSSLALIKQELIAMANEQYGVIFPCASRRTLDECFSFVNTKLILWFNTPDDSTHIMSVGLGETQNG